MSVQRHRFGLVYQKKLSVAQMFFLWVSAATCFNIGASAAVHLVNDVGLIL